MYQMLFSTHHAALYRTDLMIHHVVAFASYAYLFRVVPTIGSRILVGEYLSVLNSTMDARNVRYYRIGVLLVIRLPMWMYFIIYYIPSYVGGYISPVKRLNGFGS